jgi:hypothetical protein
MHRILLLLLPFSIPLLLNAQEADTLCGGYFSFLEGSLYEYAYYDKNDNFQSRVRSEVMFVDPVEGEEGTYVATMESRIFDEYDEQVMDGQYDVFCASGTYRTDFSNLINPAFKMSSLNASMEVTSTELVLPSDIEEGQELPEARTSVTVSSGGVDLLTTEIVVYNRKVDKRESVTTEAGTFDCFKITFDQDVKTILKKTVSGAEWWAPGVGMVKSETYKKNGKLDGYAELAVFDR